MINYNNFSIKTFCNVITWTVTVLGIRTQNISNGLKNLETSFDFSNLNKNHELCSNKKEKVAGKFRLETPKIFGLMNS